MERNDLETQRGERERTIYNERRQDTFPSDIVHREAFLFSAIARRYGSCFPFNPISNLYMTCLMCGICSSRTAGEASSPRQFSRCTRRSVGIEYRSLFHE